MQVACAQAAGQPYRGASLGRAQWGRARPGRAERALGRSALLGVVAWVAHMNWI